MTVSRDSFDKLKNYTQVQFNEEVPLLDSEVNEAQQILLTSLSTTRSKTLGTSMYGDDLRVLPGLTPNTVRVKAGTLFHDGYELTLFTDVVISFLSTPTVNRTDIVFIQFEEILVDATLDPNLIDPSLGFETTQRKKLVFECLVAEGAPAPNPAPGKKFVQLGSLHRLGLNPNVTAAMLEDDRPKSSNTYVLAGCAVTPFAGFQVNVDKGHFRVGANDFYFEAPVQVAIPANSVRYVVAQGAVDINGNEIVEVVAAIPELFPNPLAKVTTNGAGVTAIEDLRKFQPLVYHSQAEAASVQNPPENPEFDTDEEAGISLSTYTAAAGVDINKFEMVCLTNVANTVRKADHTTSATTPALAMAIMNIESGNMGTFMKKGPVTNPTWNWQVGNDKPIFLGINGALSQIPPTAPDTIIQIVAYPITSTTIEINPSSITIRN